MANLVTIHLKTGIGRLSAYCGAVSAGCGAAAGLAYLQGGDYDTVAHTVVNTVAMDSGIICDGAKASCAAKIAAAVDAGLLWLAMYRSGNQFFGGDGIVKNGADGQADHSADDGELTTAVGQPYEVYRAGTQGGSCVPASFHAACGVSVTAAPHFVTPPRQTAGPHHPPGITPSAAGLSPPPPIPHLRGR